MWSNSTTNWWSNHNISRHRCSSCIIGLKDWVVMDVEFGNVMGDEHDRAILQLLAKAFIIHTMAEIPAKLQQMAQELKVRNVNLLRLHSLCNLLEIYVAHLNLAEHNPLTRGGATEKFPEFLAQKWAIINSYNKDERCFGYAVFSPIFAVMHNLYPTKPHNYTD